ncbi:Tyrosine-protein kinase [Trema orientale]|uniref:Tyrosine-protein kinase n=1 Tax=Trema orientale TaxID=63057 RepID=A0A2P5G267_TREOI|nr:Tyrosine-protein kinase [Trema orientale]
MPIADTYSYGVVVLEILSGQKSNEIKQGDPVGEYLLQRAWKLYESNNLIELVDENLDQDEYELETVTKVIEIALMCIQSSHSLRPTMSEVVVLLKTNSLLEPRPLTRPVFVDVNQRPRGDSSTSTASSSTSNATASISRVLGR